MVCYPSHFHLWLPMVPLHSCRIQLSQISPVCLHPALPPDWSQYHSLSYSWCQTWPRPPRIFYILLPALSSMHLPCPQYFYVSHRQCFQLPFMIVLAAVQISFLSPPRNKSSVSNEVPAIIVPSSSLNLSPLQTVAARSSVCFGDQWSFHRASTPLPVCEHSDASRGSRKQKGY